MVTASDSGTYCNEVQALPGGAETSGGKTALVHIGSSNGLCPGEAALVTKTVDSMAFVSTDDTAVPFVYTFEVDFTIEVDNIGSIPMTVDNFIDLLPAGFTYNLMSIDGDVTEAPTISAIFIDGVGREQLTWDSGYVPATLAQALQPTIDELQEIVDGNPGTPLEDKLEDAIEKMETSVV